MTLYDTCKRLFSARRYGQRRGRGATRSRPSRKLICESLEDRRLMSAAGAEPALQTFAVSPALFVENDGQWSDPAIRYLHQGEGMSVAMTDLGPVFQLTRPGAAAEPAAEGMPAVDALTSQSVRFSASFLGSNVVEPVGQGLAETRFNYLVGDRSQWRSDLPGYESIVYEGLYQGIDLQSWGLRSHLKYEFHVAPGSDYHQIQVHYDGIEGLSLAADGSLRANLGEGWGELVDDAPYVYQEIAGQQVEIASRFVLLDGHTYSFEVSGSYDPTQPLVIDPDLAWSTYLGGIGSDYGNAIAVDAAGSVYVTGSTDSADFPSTTGSALTNALQDAFVAKLNPSGSGLLYSTYIGGRDGEAGYAISVDAEGNAYVAGGTGSTDFPTSAGALDNTHNGQLFDAFLFKLNPAGNGLIYSTYLGGNADDRASGLLLESNGNACVAGLTNSTNFPTTAGALKTIHAGSDYDCFLAGVSADGSTLRYSTYLGGSSYDEAVGIAADLAGNLYLGGVTESSDFPTTAGALDTTPNGGKDAFLAKLNSSGNTLLYATFLGGSGDDLAGGVAVDAAGNAYAVGHTASSDFPTTTGAWDTSFNGYYDAFVTKLNPDGSALAYSTYLGGSLWDFASGLFVDSANQVYVVGHTESTDFPTTPRALDSTSKGLLDVFLVKLDSTGSGLLYSTYLGGSADEYASAMTMDAAGNAYLTGITRSTDFPTTHGTLDTTYAGANHFYDAFVSKISGLVPPAPGSNHAPTDLALSTSSIPENRAAGTIVGAFTTTDPDAGDGFAYTLVPGTADTDNAVFTIDNAGRLRTVTSFNFEARTQYSIRVRTTDWNGLWFEKPFMVTITDVAEADCPGLYVPGDSSFFLRNDLSGGDATRVFAYGVAGLGWKELIGDWNGDGIDTPGMYDPATATFYLINRFAGGAADLTFQFGVAGQGWQPLVGDWDGDGRDSIGVYEPATSMFFLKNTFAGGDADEAVQFGVPNIGWIPIVGDWDGLPGDGLGFYDPATGNFFLKNAHASGLADHFFAFGVPGQGWLPLVGNWDGTPGDNVGLFVPQTAQWFLKNDFTTGTADIDFVYGPAGQGWRPLVGSWGDSVGNSVGRPSQAAMAAAAPVGRPSPAAIAAATDQLDLAALASQELSTTLSGDDLDLLTAGLGRPRARFSTRR